MTQLVRNSKPLFNENLFSVKSLFDSNSITVCDSPRAYGFVDNNSKTSKSFAFYIEGYFAPADNNYNWDLGDALDYTAEKTGNYVFQFNLFIENFADLSESSSKIIVYLVKNSVFTSFERNITDLIDIDLITDNVEVNIWQSFNANAGDLIQFGFRLEKVTTSTGIPVLVGDHYFSAFKLGLIKGDEEISPTPYSLPIGYIPDSNVLSYEEKTADYTLTNDDDTVQAYTASIVFTLPSALTNKGKIFTIDNSSGGSITVNTSLSQTISGGEIDPPVTTATLLNQEILTVQSNGLGYRLR